MRAGFPCALEIKKIIPKTTHESCRREKTGVELTVMAGNRDQEDDIIGEIISMILYAMLVMTVGIGF